MIQRFTFGQGPNGCKRPLSMAAIWTVSQLFDPAVKLPLALSKGVMLQTIHTHQRQTPTTGETKMSMKILKYSVYDANGILWGEFEGTSEQDAMQSGSRCTFTSKHWPARLGRCLV
jgi:hypothetical protein